MSDVYLTFDIGGTRIKSGTVDDSGEVRSRSIVPTHGERGADDLIARIIALGQALRNDIRPGDHLRAIGIAFTGVIDPERGVVLLLNGKIPDIEGVDVGPRLAAAFGVPASIDNDTRVYTVGEWQHGAASGHDNVVCITIGTGIGSGVITNGHLLQTRGMVGGILGGHLTVDINGPLCSCGNRGCLEAVASVPALLAYLRDHLARGYPSRLARHIGQEVQALTVEMVLHEVTGGDELASFAFDRWVRQIGAGLVTLIHTHDPDVVVIGGGIMHASDVVLPPLQEYVRRHAWTWPKGRTLVRTAELGDDAALIGGAALAKLRMTEINPNTNMRACATKRDTARS